ncbi:MAG TPA: FAD/NAD(P)-binding oxidoreductase [Spirochaeta sp.]|nr:FAD/NAD(P)-binding oxidoreductase [Spirochaeta sp.]
MIYDVIIIGAGLVGGAVARELSKYNLSVLALEKEADVCCGTSKANTGIIHSAALIPPGTIKSHMAVRGAPEFERLSGELGFSYQKTGALVAGFSPDDETVMEKYIVSGTDNYRQAGMQPPDYRIVRGDELKRMEPSLNEMVVSALFAPDTGRIIPYEYGIALWENAVENGVRLELNDEVETIDKSADTGWNLKTQQHEFRARFLVNAAGHGSSGLGLTAGFADGQIQLVKGQYLILDRTGGPEINHILFQVPQGGHKKKGKGILVTKTVYGNTMIGPDARWQKDDADTSTDMEALDEVVAGAVLSVPEISPSACIKTFAGVRPKPAGGDFIIESERGFVHLCGIESPGLTSSPAIAVEVAARLESMGLTLSKRDDFQPVRKAVVKQVLALPPEEVKRRIGIESGGADRLVCRCEQVPESRIRDAVGRGIPVETIDGVKRRTRAGQGRCQGGYCGARVRDLLADTLGMPAGDITQRGNEPELDRVKAREIKERFKK